MTSYLNLKNRDGLRMSIKVYDVETSVGTAIIHHGFPGASTSPTIQLMAETFNKLGLTSYVPDTTHNFNRSGGHLADMTLAGHVNDLEDVVKYVANIPRQQGPLVLAGHSAGGHSALAVSARLAGQGQYKPDLTIASAPVISGQSFVESLSRILGSSAMSSWQQTGFMPMYSDADDGRTELQVSWKTMAEWATHHLVDQAIFPSNPTVILHPTKDVFIPVADIAQYAEAGHVEETHFIHDAGHGYQGHEEQFATTLKKTTQRHLDRLSAQNRDTKLALG